MSDLYDKPKEEINSLLQSIIESVTKVQKTFRDEYMYTTLEMILRSANKIKIEILPSISISNTGELDNLRAELTNIINVASLLSNQTQKYSSTNSVWPVMQEVLRFTNDINDKINYLKIIPSVPAHIQEQESTLAMSPPTPEVPTSTQIDTTKFDEIGKSTRPPDKGKPSWMDIIFGETLNKKIASLLPGVKKWDDCQFIGGFDIPKGASLDLLDPVSVFKRLNKLATNNIVAVSELIIKITKKMRLQE